MAGRRAQLLKRFLVETLGCWSLRLKEAPSQAVLQALRAEAEP